MAPDRARSFQAPCEIRTSTEDLRTGGGSRRRESATSGRAPDQIDSRGQTTGPLFRFAPGQADADALAEAVWLDRAAMATTIAAWSLPVRVTELPEVALFGLPVPDVR